MGTDRRGNKVVVIVEVVLLVAGCAALGALLLKNEDAPPQRVQLTMAPSVPDVARRGEVSAGRVPDRPDRVARSRGPSTAPVSTRRRAPRQPAVAPIPDVTAPAPAPAPKAKKPKAPPTIEREALSFVGIDPLAEAIWVDAINDPSIDAEARSDLIEDLNEDGFANPRRLTPDDLPMIVSRLALIERLAPDAMDDVNAAAFAEAYKDLTNMYARVTGIR